ncbi:MAG: hypothetical protein WBV77_07600 [Solirubrobacteraceae bacterium]
MGNIPGFSESAVEHAWSRKLLEHHIATRRYEREGKALTNFSRTLEPTARAGTR